MPVNMAANVMRSLIETGTVSRGFLGVGGDPITPDIAEQVHLPKDATGVIVTDTIPDGPADKAGIKRGDVILSVNGKAITNHDELRLDDFPDGSGLQGGAERLPGREADVGQRDASQFAETAKRAL